MTKSDWSELLIKLFALTQILAGVFAIPAIVGLFAALIPSLNQQNVQMPYFYILAAIGIIVLVPAIPGLIIWRIAPTVSRWMWLRTSSKATARSSKDVKANLFGIKKAAIVGIGLFAFVNRIPVVISTIGNAILRNQQFSDLGNPDAMTFLHFQELVGYVALFLGVLITLILIAIPTRVLLFLERIQKSLDAD